MSKEMVISANPHETRVAIMEEGQLCEYYVEREKEFALVGSIYKGRVTRVLPGMQSAFVEIGLDSDAFLYVSDFLEEIEELDHIVTTVEDKVQKMEEQGGQVFAANTGDCSSHRAGGCGTPHAATSAAPAAYAGSGAALEPLPGESIRPCVGQGRRRFACRDSPLRRRHGSDRGRFENRARGGRPGGDRGGRFGRRGGGAVVDRTQRWRRQTGRGSRWRVSAANFPSSKYASPRPSEEHSSRAGERRKDTSQHFCPGESLAKYQSDEVSAAAAHRMRLKRRRAIRLLSISMNLPRMNRSAWNVQEDVQEDAQEGLRDPVARSHSADEAVERRPAPREASSRGSSRRGRFSAA